MASIKLSLTKDKQPQQPQTVKSCIFCEHCLYNEPVWYGTLTGGDSGYFACYENDSQNMIEESDLSNLAGWTLKANTCEHYQLSDAIKKELNI